ncbi:MAG: hypothetical protein AAGB31_12080 [Bdellovibrio sp.]
MKASLIWAALLTVVQAASAEVGFSGGNARTSVLVKGRIYVECQDTGGIPQHAQFRCEEDILLPTDYDYFQGPAGVTADEVILKAVREDGSSRTKDSGYDTAKARSTQQFNLWIHTLTQKPLLKMGRNQVAYTLKQKGKVTASGQFTAEVQDGGEKVCPRTGYYWSHNRVDCQSGASLCSRFFAENNYCL